MGWGWGKGWKNISRERCKQTMWKANQGIRTVDLSNFTLLCSSFVALKHSEILSQSTSLSQTRTLERRILNWALSKLLANWLWKDPMMFYESFYCLLWSCNYWILHLTWEIQANYLGSGATANHNASKRGVCMRKQLSETELVWCRYPSSRAGNFLITHPMRS